MFDSFQRNGKKRLEIIIDSCSTGGGVHQGAEALMHYTDTFRQDRFSEIKAIIPIQIGTEMKQRIFPEFLHAELSDQTKKDVGKMRGFYQRNVENIEIVETDASRAYKMLFAQKAADLLNNNPELKSSVREKARKLAERYTPHDIADEEALTEGALTKLIDRIIDAGPEIDARWSEAKRKIETHNTEIGAMSGDARKALLDSEERKVMARAEHEIFGFPEGAPNDLETRVNRFLLQSMYSCDPLYQEIAQERDYKTMRNNRGERAIEQFLFDRSGNLSPQPVSLVISNDYKAHPPMRNMYQKKGKNPFFVMGNGGLGYVLDNLIPEPEVRSMLDFEQRHCLDSMEKCAENLIGKAEALAKPGKKPLSKAKQKRQDRLESDQESAQHFANYMVTGQLELPRRMMARGME